MGNCCILKRCSGQEEAELIMRGLKKHGVSAEFQPCEGSFNVMIGLSDIVTAQELLNTVDFAAEEKL